jgi:hypothetical protein
MTQGNPIALRRTLESMKGYVNEVILGDVILFQADRDLIRTYEQEFNMRIIELPFNYIFKHGFSSILNHLSDLAHNDLCIYMNCGEIIDPVATHKVQLDIPGYNCGFFDHVEEKHKWIRYYNRTALRWSGLIHEEVKGPRKCAPELLFTMADTPKDDTSLFKSNICNDVKEICYFQQYIRLVEEPDTRGITNVGWIKWAKENHKHFQAMLQAKGVRYEAFIEGNLEKYINGALSDSKLATDEDIEFGHRRYKDPKLQSKLQ